MKSTHTVKGKQGSEISRSEPMKCYLMCIGNNFPGNNPYFHPTAFYPHPEPGP